MTQARAKKRVPIPLKTDEGPSWIAIIVTAVIQLYPITAILGFLKLRAIWRKKRLGTYRTYLGVVGSRMRVSLNKIASTVGQSRDAVVHVLGEMIQKGYLGPDAYIDYSIGYLVIEPGARAEDDPEAEAATGETASGKVKVDLDLDLSGLKDIIGDIASDIRGSFAEPARRPRGRHSRRSAQEDIPYAPPEEQQQQQQPEPAHAEQKETEREAIRKKLRALNDQILDEDVSRNIERIGELTDDIHEFIDQNPDRASQVRKFMNYYLPTTVKLLTSYSMLERQSYQGENIVASRKNIEDILATLVQAFEKQLDQLFAAEAIDISSDIQVLETMIAKDGLTQQAMQLRL